jgi:hypothetical protein
MQNAVRLLCGRGGGSWFPLGFTAAGATVPVGILTLADAKARMDHKAELMRAWSDYYAGARCKVQGNELEPSLMI